MRALLRLGSGLGLGCRVPARPWVQRLRVGLGPGCLGRRASSSDSGGGISVGIIGVGQMGSAMLQGFLKTDSVASTSITCYDIDSGARGRATSLGVSVAADNLGNVLR